MNKILAVDKNEVDLIENFPIQMFHQVDKTQVNKICRVDGKGKRFKIGNKLRVNSLTYNYVDNFLIINLNSFESCIVKNMKICKITNKLSEKDILNVEEMYTPTGIKINASNLDELYQLKNELSELNNKTNKLIADKNKLLLDIRDKIDEDIESFILIKPQIDKIDSDLKKLNEDFKSKWFLIDKDYDNIIQFGLYLSCLVEKMNFFSKIQYLQHKLENGNKLSAKELKLYKSFSKNKFEEGLDFTKLSFEIFLSNKQGLNKKYLEWLDLNTSKMSKEDIYLIEEIILNINFYLDI